MANLYDLLDRQVITTLYNTTETVASLQADIAAAPSESTVTVTNGAAPSVTATLSQTPVTATSLNSSTVTTVQAYKFYDNYSFGATKTFDNNFTNTTAYSTSDPN